MDREVGRLVVEGRRDSLLMLVRVREGVERCLEELRREEGEERKVVVRRMEGPRRMLTRMVQRCWERCEGCTSCGVLLIDQVAEVLTSSNRRRGEVLHLLEVQGGKGREVLRKRSRGEELDRCTEERVKVWDMVR